MAIDALLAMDSSTNVGVRVGFDGANPIPGTIYFTGLNASGTIAAAILTQGGVAVLDASTSFSGDVTGNKDAMTVEKIRGIDVDTIAPGNKEILKFDNDPAENRFKSELSISQRVDVPAYAGTGYVGSGWSVATIDPASVLNFKAETFGSGLAALGDKIQIPMFLTRGDYYVIIVYEQQSGGGVGTIWEDSGSGNIGSIDFNSPSGLPTPNQFYENPTYTVSTTGLKTFEIEITDDTNGAGMSVTSVHFIPLP